MLSEDFKSGEVLLIPCDVITFSCESKEKTTKLSLPHTNLKTKGSSPLLKKRPRLLGMKPSAFVFFKNIYVIFFYLIMSLIIIIETAHKSEFICTFSRH